MKIFFLFFMFILCFASKNSEEKTLSLDEQLPENYFWGLEENIFNHQTKRETFLQKLFNQQEVEKIGQSHLCLYKDEIIEHNKSGNQFNGERLQKVFNEKCFELSEDTPFVSHNLWEGTMYRSADSKKFCRSKNECALIIEEDVNKIVFGWINHGVEVFHKTDQNHFKVSKDSYDLSSFIKRNGFDKVPNYVQILPFSGGIGNQLFTYWGAVSYARTHNRTPIRMHEFPLDSFLDLPVKTNYPEELFPPVFVKRYFGLEKCIFWNDVPVGKQCFELSGYLQSWKNFIGNEDYIRENMIFKNEIPLKNQEIISKMKKENAVAVHVRRGDYLYNGYFLLTQNYYSQAVDYIKRNVNNPTFYIFSNDQKWARENIKIDGPHIYVDWTQKDYEDLQLMTYCKHFINANSSFSWWGSFLSKNKNKIIISPDKDISWNPYWIKNLIAPHFIVIENEKHYFDVNQNKFVTE